METRQDAKGDQPKSENAHRFLGVVCSMAETQG